MLDAPAGIEPVRRGATAFRHQGCRSAHNLANRAESRRIADEALRLAGRENDPAFEAMALRIAVSLRCLRAGSQLL